MTQCGEQFSIHRAVRPCSRRRRYHSAPTPTKPGCSAISFSALTASRSANSKQSKAATLRTHGLGWLSRFKIDVWTCFSFRLSAFFVFASRRASLFAFLESDPSRAAPFLLAASTYRSIRASKSGREFRIARKSRVRGTLHRPPHDQLYEP